MTQLPSASKMWTSRLITSRLWAASRLAVVWSIVRLSAVRYWQPQRWHGFNRTIIRVKWKPEKRQSALSGDKNGGWHDGKGQSYLRIASGSDSGNLGCDHLTCTGLCWWFRNPKQPPFGCTKLCKKHGLNLDKLANSTGDRRISEPSTGMLNFRGGSRVGEAGIPSLAWCPVATLVVNVP